MEIIGIEESFFIRRCNVRMKRRINARVRIWKRKKKKKCFKTISSDEEFGLFDVRESMKQYYKSASKEYTADKLWRHDRERRI